MYTEDDLLMLSALQHIQFCERQCALIHIEQLWSDNLFTAQGNIMHERVDEAARESRGRIRTVFAMPLRSLRLGLSGKADAVEFHRLAEDNSVWHPFPVEYKRGKPKKDDCDLVQLCAQALCLEEMLSMEIPAGALFYGQTRHREDVLFDQRLRGLTEETAARLHQLIRGGKTPAAKYEKKCESCSLLELCLPKVTDGKHRVAGYLTKILAATGTTMP